MTIVPLSLYIHLPWCIKKCPYCDFNSHAITGPLPEEAYVDRLIEELDTQLPAMWGRRLCSIFIGGGTPSLFSASALSRLLNAICTRLPFTSDLEITLEANPGTAEAERFKKYRALGINRLSLGVQSFNDKHLKILGRIHDSTHAKRAIAYAMDAGFNNINLDVMFALPHQTLDEAILDLHTTINFNPTHISWYQLTLEKNTAFYNNPPPLPCDEDVWEMQLQGMALLQSHHFNRYEVSAYSQAGRVCKHNRNYWEFGDYLGLGAGAHSKLTHHDIQQVVRHWNVKNPKDYLNREKPIIENQRILSKNDLSFEFMLNALRLEHGVSLTIFTERTGLLPQTIDALLTKAKAKKLLIQENNIIKPTELGGRFLNDLMMIFL